MPRPQKCRRVAFLPNATYFKPAGIPLRILDEIQLSVEEAEAIRLKDLENLDQKDGAQRMNVSRPTFQRILTAGRLKIADALLNSKAIRIGGGNYEMTCSKFKCPNGHEWEVPFEEMSNVVHPHCPTCNASSIEPFLPTRFRRRGKGRGRNIGNQKMESHQGNEK